MVREIQASDAKTHLPQLLDDVERGETLIIARLPITIDRTPEEHAVLTLARTHRLTINDASYLELAHREHLPSPPWTPTSPAPPTPKTYPSSPRPPNEGSRSFLKKEPENFCKFAPNRLGY